jgi:hypothetical protein
MLLQGADRILQNTRLFGFVRIAIGQQFFPVVIITVVANQDNGGSFMRHSRIMGVVMDTDVCPLPPDHKDGPLKG